MALSTCFFPKLYKPALFCDILILCVLKKFSATEFHLFKFYALKTKLADAQ